MYVRTYVCVCMYVCMCVYVCVCMTSKVLRMKSNLEVQFSQHSTFEQPTAHPYSSFCSKELLCCPLKSSKKCSCMATRRHQNYSRIFVVHPQNCAGNGHAQRLQNTINSEQADVTCGRKIISENFGHRFINSTGDLTVILTPLNRHVYFTFPSGKKCAITESARL